MAAVTKKHHSFHDEILLRLAREIAMDIHTIEDVLKIHEVTQGQWDAIRELPTFQNYLRNALQEWNSASNTSERVRLKSLHFVEEALPEFYARAHDKDENLLHKTEILKTVAKLAGLDKLGTEGSIGEKLSVTINLGSDHQLRVEKDITSQVTIEGKAQ